MFVHAIAYVLPAGRQAIGVANTPEPQETVMSLHPRRTAAYLAGACAGGLTTAALVSVRRRDARAVARRLAMALLAGTLAVGFEAAAPDDA